MLAVDFHDDDDNKKLWLNIKHDCCPVYFNHVAFVRVIVPSRWIRKWILFCQLRAGEEPGKITMMSLLVKDPAAPGGYRPKNTLKQANYAKLDNPNADDHPGHYRYCYSLAIRCSSLMIKSGEYRLRHGKSYTPFMEQMVRHLQW